jgi:hypothetical protein
VQGGDQPQPVVRMAVLLICYGARRTARRAGACGYAGGLAGAAGNAGAGGVGAAVTECEDRSGNAGATASRPLPYLNMVNPYVVIDTKLGYAG